MKKNITIDEYHADKRAISSSGFPYLERAPKLYVDYLRGKFSSDKTHFRIGNAFHDSILLPDLFDSMYVVVPKLDKRSAVNKTKYQELKEEATSNGKILIEEDEYNTVKYLADCVLKHPIAKEFLEQDGEREMSIFWETRLLEYSPEGKSHCYHCGFITEVDDDNEVECGRCGELYSVNAVYCKARPDFYNEDMVIDLKTAKSISPRSFLYGSVMERGYHRQAALQMAAIQSEEGNFNTLDLSKPYYWIAVEKDTGLVAVYKASNNLLTSGSSEYMGLLRTYKQCLDSDNWPGVETIIEL